MVKDASQPLVEINTETNGEGFLVAQRVKNLPAMRETWIRSLGWEDPLEEGVATHSSILAWRIPMDKSARGRRGARDPWSLPAPLFRGPWTCQSWRLRRGDGSRLLPLCPPSLLVSSWLPGPIYWSHPSSLHRPSFPTSPAWW